MTATQYKFISLSLVIIYFYIIDLIIKNHYMKLLLGTIGIGVYIISLRLFPMVAQLLKMKRVPKMSTVELKAMFALRSNFRYYHQAALELKRRGEDISFTLPAFLDVALSGGKMELIGKEMELIGKGCLKHHFPDKVSHIHPDGFLSPEERKQLEELKEKVGS